MFQVRSCEEIVQRLAESLDDPSPPLRRRWDRRHLRRCPRCAADLDQLRWTIDQLRSLPRERIPPTRRAALLQAFHARRTA